MLCSVRMRMVVRMLGSAFCLRFLAPRFRLRFGFRLCQETEEKAKYFGIQFKEIWADYLAFNFTVENN